MDHPQFNASKVEAERIHFESIQNSQTLDRDGVAQYLDEVFTANKDDPAVLLTAVTPSNLANSTAQQCLKDLKQERISFDTFLGMD